MEDELVEETHDSLRMGRRTLSTTIESTLAIRHMLGPFEPAIDTVPTESVSRGYS